MNSRVDVGDGRSGDGDDDKKAVGYARMGDRVCDWICDWVLESRPLVRGILGINTLLFPRSWKCD